MHWIDWVIVIVPLVAIVWLAFYCRRFVRGVVDYLSAGRVAGRYVLTVGDMTAGLGAYYASGIDRGKLSLRFRYFLLAGRDRDDRRVYRINRMGIVQIQGNQSDVQRTVS